MYMELPESSINEKTPHRLLNNWIPEASYIFKEFTHQEISFKFFIFVALFLSQYIYYVTNYKIKSVSFWVGCGFLL